MVWKHITKKSGRYIDDTGEGLQILLILGTHGHLAARVLYRATPIVTRWSIIIW